jgi:ADP-ribosyl-[dinitrogen reductase] hydrolase
MLANIKKMLIALCAGDCIGSLTEFVGEPNRIIAAYDRYKADGWPFAPVAGGPFGWRRGEATDDGQMALAMLTAFRKHGAFDEEATAAEFIKWYRSAPKDMGGQTRRVLSRLHRGENWASVALSEQTSYPDAWGNGGLMRNGIVPGMASNPVEAVQIAIRQTSITHPAARCLVCSALHSWSIVELAAGRWPLRAGYWSEFREAWDAAIALPLLAPFVERDAERVQEALADVEAADFEHFDPFNEIENAGEALTSLRVAFWILDWSRKDAAQMPALPAGYPHEVFRRRGGDVLGWVGLIGRDADTYGAIAGPMIAALHGDLPSSMTKHLEVVGLLAKQV